MRFAILLRQTCQLFLSKLLALKALGEERYGLKKVLYKLHDIFLIGLKKRRFDLEPRFEKPCLTIYTNCECQDQIVHPLFPFSVISLNEMNMLRSDCAYASLFCACASEKSLRRIYHNKHQFLYAGMLIRHCVGMKYCQRKTNIVIIRL